MPDNQNQPRKDDAVLGGESPPPVEGFILGGIEGVKRRLSSPVIEARVAALNEALNYADAGLELVIQALKDKSKQVQRSAYRLLRQRVEDKVRQALREYKPWNLVERLGEYPGYKNMYVSTFANRQVTEFDPQTGITDPVGTAYALRFEYDEAAVKGDQAPPPIDGIVLGGLQGVKHRLTSPVVEARVAALSEALNYGEAGIDLLIQVLQDSVNQVQISAARLLRKRGGIKGKQALLDYDPLLFFSNLDNWNNEDFNPEIGITPPVEIAYIVRSKSEFQFLLQNPQAKKIEALKCQIGYDYRNRRQDFRDWVNALLKAGEQLRLHTLNVSENRLSTNIIQPLSQLNCRVIAESQFRNRYDSVWE